jgi:hypothetical protein
LGQQHGSLEVAKERMRTHRNSLELVRMSG